MRFVAEVRMALGQYAKVKGQRAKGQRTKDKGQRAKGKGQRAKGKGQRAKGKGGRSPGARRPEPYVFSNSVISATTMSGMSSCRLCPPGRPRPVTLVP